MSKLESGEKRSFCFLSVDTVGSSIIKGTKRNKQKTFEYLSKNVKKTIEKYNGVIINWDLDGGSAIFLDCKDYNVYNNVTLAGIEIILLQPFFNKYFNLLKDPLILRVNIHYGNGIWNKDLSFFSSDEFSKFIKFERNFGEPGKLVISSLVYDELGEEIRADFIKTGRKYCNMELYVYNTELSRILTESQDKTTNFLKSIEERDKILKRLEEILNNTSITKEEGEDYTAKFFKEGLLYLAEKNYSKAFNSFSTCIGFSLQHKEAWYRRGEAIYYIGNKDEAINSIKKALEIDPHYNEALDFLRKIREGN